MKKMAKIGAGILAVSLMVTAMALPAMAEDGQSGTAAATAAVSARGGQPGGRNHGQMTQTPGSGNNQQGQRPQMPGNSNNNQQGQMPQMPGNGNNNQGQMPQTPAEDRKSVV